MAENDNIIIKVGQKLSTFDGSLNKYALINADNAVYQSDSVTASGVYHHIVASNILQCALQHSAINKLFDAVSDEF